MHAWWRRLAAVVGLVMAVSLVGCGGGVSNPFEDPPSITTQPVSSTLTVGDSATFTVAATGDDPLTYQWQRNGTDIAGATSPSYTLASVAEADSGAQFRVVVSNDAGSATSSAAVLTVVIAPTIVSEPVGTTVNPGTAATFRVVADGTGPLSYQWQRDGTDIPGATADSYTLASPVLADNDAAFRVVVTSGVGTATSANATLAVTEDILLAPTIVTQPQSITIVDGAPLVLSVAATGTTPFSYQWRKNGVDIPGATSSSYATASLTPADSGAAYSVVVTNGPGSATSANATVTVTYLALDWLLQPSATSVVRGQSAIFIAGAFGSQPVTYQWQRNGIDIPGATGVTYTTPATTAADDGALYAVVATNPAGSITSRTAALTVQGVPVAPTIATAPASLTVSAGQAASFSVTASGTAPFSYQWLRNGVNIVGATATSYTIAATTAADNAARFSVRVNNASGSVTSAEAVLTVQAVPGPLTGRGWKRGQGQLLEADDNVVRDRVSAIDDAGRVTVVFRKNNGTRDVLYATRGTPNAKDAAPTWSTPVAIDVLGGAPVSTMGVSEDYNVVVAPGGNALAYWWHAAPCTAVTYSTSTFGSCRYYYMARYTESSNSWSEPELIGDAPSPAFKAVINDRGDVALFGTSWIRSGTSSRTAAPALFSRGATQATLSRQLVNAVPLSSWVFDMDASGNLLLAAEAQQNGTTDLVAFRGTADAGLGPQQVLDTRGVAANLLTAKLGLNGQQLILWSQNNGVTNTTYGASSPNASTGFTVQDLGFLIDAPLNAAITDEGQAYVVNFSSRRRVTWNSASGWSALQALPSSVPTGASYARAVNRAGEALLVNTFGSAGGTSMTYDPRANAAVATLPTSPPDDRYVLGLGRSMGWGRTLLSASGIGFIDILDNFDVLPTPDAPTGDGRAVNNLWGVYFK